MQTAYIGLGSNLASAAGSPEETLAAAVQCMEELGEVVRRSSLYSTAPVGFADQPRFVNAVIALRTPLGPRPLLEGLLDIERDFGRDRTARIQNGPRTLDLDLLFYGDWVLHESDLDLPHPRLAERGFVLVPLHEIASNLVDASRGASVKELLQRLRDGLPSELDAILPLQSHSWRAGPCTLASDEDAGSIVSDADH